MLSKHYNFANMAVKKVENRITFMHDSNQEIAHNSCGPKYCHYFVNGSLYKCFLTAISNEIIDQFTIENRAVSILKKYKPCSPWDSQDNIEKYVTNLKFSIEQCKLCPEKTNIKPIWPLNLKKINF